MDICKFEGTFGECISFDIRRLINLGQAFCSTTMWFKLCVKSSLF